MASQHNPLMAWGRRVSNPDLRDPLITSTVQLCYGPMTIHSECGVGELAHGSSAMPTARRKQRRVPRLAFAPTSPFVSLLPCLAMTVPVHSLMCFRGVHDVEDLFAINRATI